MATSVLFNQVETMRFFVSRIVNEDKCRDEKGETLEKITQPAAMGLAELHITVRDFLNLTTSSHSGERHVHNCCSINTPVTHSTDLYLFYY